MRQMQNGRGRRGAFTVIELLVVVAIIAILAGLTTAAVMRMYGKGTEAKCRSEIGQLSTAVGAFKQEFPAAQYLPSQFVLHNSAARYVADATATGKASWAFLQQMFGKRVGVNPVTGKTTLAFNWVSGGNTPATTTLYGDQCLVFFLGGVQGQSPASCLGFSADPTNPTTAGGTRRGPFYDFKSPRLFVAPKNSTYFSYQDPFNHTNLKPSNQVPFAYFSSQKATNSYNATDVGVSLPTYGLTKGPYYAPGNTVQYFNPSSFQIISAGPDGVFGPGGSWNPTAGYGAWRGPSGSDDMANFSSAVLAGPQS